MGRSKRLYDTPQTPLARLLASGVLSPQQAEELAAHRDSINPAELTRDIARLQCILTGLAKSKTERLIEEAEKARQHLSGKQQGGVRVVTQ